jgi:hypothetical protein
MNHERAQIAQRVGRQITATRVRLFLSSYPGRAACHLLEHDGSTEQRFHTVYVQDPSILQKCRSVIVKSVAHGGGESCRLRIAAMLALRGWCVRYAAYPVVHAQAAGAASNTVLPWHSKTEYTTSFTALLYAAAFRP